MDYPRPQLQRSDWISLNGIWRFKFDDEAHYGLPADIKEWPQKIEVPFAPECSRSGIGDTGFHRVCWYQRDLAFELPTQGRTLLHFGAVDYLAHVWVNDMLVGRHRGGHTPFTADITHALDRNGKQQITVRVEDDPEDLEKPRGKQDWKLDPHSIWYYRTTGIWQTVWLENVPETYIRRLRWTPHLERWEIGFEAFIYGPIADEMEVFVKLTRGEQVLVQDSYKVISGEVHRRIALSDPGIEDFRNDLLWSPEHPTIINAEIKLMRDCTVIDEVTSYSALRSVRVHRDRFLLNGRPYQLRLVLDQGYWPDTLMTAPSDEALRRDVELAKAMGFNGVRKHQKLEDPRYLFWADTLGLVVWDEMPSAYRFTTRSMKRLMREWIEAIERDFSHPCIIVWVPFNESWGVPDLTATQAHRDAVHALYYLTKTLDPTRPVIGNDGWESSATDIIGIHDYDSNHVTLRERYGPQVKPEELFDRRRPGGRILTLDGFPHRGQPIILTEFGGVAYAREEDEFHKKAWGYVRRDSIEEFEAQTLSLIEVARTTGMFSGFCYTQFADTFQEANGLLYADRTPKIPIERIYTAVRGKIEPGALYWESV
ncbi:glycoside hydrolase family 2 protein [Geobacter sp. DSM 9736]|uniref:glycoside hydrolase family 2 protein n=1 Tax=Geobacter sp. DSM 9736 TaxID=1277350 RepID=UPI000B509CF0|nr:glycoside hydrolase family 2 TIM barrel-domain containing protein [Geobacter sp. DSM 9736]SNB47509.1 Glycosyl hydrolases family 2, sugar binding domain [Geobacter sp. DSM 9736]